MTPHPQRLKCIHRMVCYRHNGEGADRAWGTDAGCISDCNQYVTIASQQSERALVLDEIELFRKNNSKEYTIYSLWVMEAQYLQELHQQGKEEQG